MSKCPFSGLLLLAAAELEDLLEESRVVEAAVAATVNQGDGGLDHSGLFKQVLQLSGRK